MKTLVLSLFIVLIYTFTVLDIKANETVSICGCPEIPYGLEGIATPIDQDTHEWLVMFFNQQGL